MHIDALSIANLLGRIWVVSSGIASAPKKKSTVGALSEFQLDVNFKSLLSFTSGHDFLRGECLLLTQSER